MIKRYPIQIWFLSEDMQQSAEWLSNKHLVKTINGCMNALLATRFYYIGIRTPKFYKYYFDKERKRETLDRFFPCWPLKQKPSYMAYKTKTSKWCRMCREHYDYVKQYMAVLLQEYEYRYKKPHGLSRFIEWLEFDAPELSIPEGKLTVISLPWKCLNPKYRDKDICQGYRNQYKAVMTNDGIKLADYKNRDIPEFLVQKQNNWL